MVQIRERDLSAREVFYIANTIADSSAGARTQILVNDRADIAQSAGAGVHLRADSLSVNVVRAAFGTDMLIGVSTHTPAELTEAEKSGADFAVFGPVFETTSKKEYGEPVGIEALRKVTAHLTIPVLALGGVNLSNFSEVLDAGAAGIAGISMFAEAQDLGHLVATIKSHRRPGS
jgi:thiamine-phosphate pyrophosphorylase